jgi:hypothetical protein
MLAGQKRLLPPGVTACTQPGAVASPQWAAVRRPPRLSGRPAAAKTTVTRLPCASAAIVRSSFGNSSSEGDAAATERLGNQGVARKWVPDLVVRMRSRTRAYAV